MLGVVLTTPAASTGGGPRLHADDFVGRRLNLVARRFRDRADQDLSAAGLGLTGWLLLKHAAHAPEPGPSQRELAGHLHIGGPGLVRHIDRLESEGFIVRVPDPVDRRVTRIVVTPAGRRREEELTVIAEALDDEIRGVLTTQERTVLLRALAKIDAHLAGAPTALQSAERP